MIFTRGRHNFNEHTLLRKQQKSLSLSLFSRQYVFLSIFNARESLVFVKNPYAEINGCFLVEFRALSLSLSSNFALKVFPEKFAYQTWVRREEDLIFNSDFSNADFFYLYNVYFNIEGIGREIILMRLTIPLPHSFAITYRDKKKKKKEGFDSREYDC